MNEHPILFSSEMVRAILVSRKTMTRRVIKPQPSNDSVWCGWILDTTGNQKDIGKAKWKNDLFGYGQVTTSHKVRCPYGQPGSRLWLKETWAKAPHGLVYRANYLAGDGQDVVDIPTGEMIPLVWKSSRFMPRWASRITLEILNIRVERLKEITVQDIFAEGVSTFDHEFKPLWDSLNAKRGFGWDVNPWVWVIEFKRL
jgi:hypothetical protein